MKKLITILVTAAMLLSMLGIAVSAGSYVDPQFVPCQLSVTLKQANPDLVQKDGKISEGEYERFEVSLDTDPASDAPTPIWAGFGNDTGTTMEGAEHLIQSMEYYFSWDEVHGFNIAVKCKPDLVRQVLSVDPNAEKPGDDFLTQTGFYLAADPVKVLPPKSVCSFYYALAKNTETGEYIEGHYQQFGEADVYDPEADEDYVISYEDDGSVILEWSVPLSTITPNTSVGSEFGFTLCATTTTDAEATETDFNKVCVASFGDYGFMIQGKNRAHATAVISDEKIPEPINVWENPYTDIKEGAWYYDAVEYVCTEGLMNGMTETTFEPLTSMSRGMLVTVLWRAEGSPTPNAAAPFDDLTKNYYKDAIAWAVENNIANGTGNNKFEPELALSRETIATLLSRYAEYKGITSDKTADLATFPDGADVSGWAKTGMEWAVANGIITGKKSGDQDLLAAKMTSNRAEVATMLMRFNSAFGE